MKKQRQWNVQQFLLHNLRVCIIALAFLLPTALQAAFDGGTGTKTDPYLISTADQLNDVRNNLTSHFKLTADIDLSGFSNWVPIGNYSNYFKGSFDGNGHIISNMTINTTVWRVGLFGS